MFWKVKVFLPPSSFNWGDVLVTWGGGEIGNENHKYKIKVVLDEINVTEFDVCSEQRGQIAQWWKAPPPPPPPPEPQRINDKDDGWIKKWERDEIHVFSSYINQNLNLKTTENDIFSTINIFTSKTLTPFLLLPTPPSLFPSFLPSSSSFLSSSSLWTV